METARLPLHGTSGPVPSARRLSSGAGSGRRSHGHAALLLRGPRPDRAPDRETAPRHRDDRPHVRTRHRHALRLDPLAGRKSRALRRIVVLDCCYSARAFGAQSSAAALEVDGTYLLAAAAETAVALSPPGEPLTAFTGEWLTLMRDGVPGEGQYPRPRTRRRVRRHRTRPGPPGADALEARLRKVCRSSVRAPGTSGGGSLDVTGSVSWAACGLSAERVLERSGELLHERKLRRSAPVSV